ncbi:MAG: septal ring lytic transglycosylase RlpA family protein [Acidobacteriota bacterium]
MNGTAASPGRESQRKGGAFPRLALVLLALAAASACAGTRNYQPPPGPRSGVEVGYASWYGGEFNGRRTSNGEIYDMHDMTAAHPSLPFGTCLMVTNLDNQQTAIVRVNDRGPFVKGRIIDLSYASARVLGMIGPGTSRVRLEVLPNCGAASPGSSVSPPSAAGFSVQVGAFAVQENAYGLKKRLEPRYDSVVVTALKTPERTYYRVRVRARDREAALRTARRLADEGFPVILLEE